VKDLAPFLQEMRDEIKRQVLLFGDDGRSTARLNKLLRDLEEALTGLTGDWRTKLIEDLKELAAYEAEWNVKTLTSSHIWWLIRDVSKLIDKPCGAKVNSIL